MPNKIIYLERMSGTPRGLLDWAVRLAQEDLSGLTEADWQAKGYELDAFRNTVISPILEERDAKKAVTTWAEGVEVRCASPEEIRAAQARWKEVLDQLPGTATLGPFEYQFLFSFNGESFRAGMIARNQDPTGIVSFCALCTRYAEYLLVCKRCRKFAVAKKLRHETPVKRDRGYCSRECQSAASYAAWLAAHDGKRPRPGQAMASFASGKVRKWGKRAHGGREQGMDQQDRALGESAMARE